MYLYRVLWVSCSLVHFSWYTRVMTRFRFLVVELVAYAQKGHKAWLDVAVLRTSVMEYMGILAWVSKL